MKVIAMDYQQARNEVLHSAYGRALVDASWLDPQAMQRIIAAEGGLPAYDGHLAHLRADLRLAETNAAKTRTALASTRGEIATLSARLESYRRNPPGYRDHTGRLVPAHHLESDAKQSLADAQESARRLTELLDYDEGQALALRRLEGRLVAAVSLAHRQALEAQPSPPPPPVVNVTVQTPDELRITAMPPRRTTTEIVRDPETGAIVSSEQVEQDA